VLGALSDRYGRRPVLLLGFCGLALNFFVTALATTLWMLVAVRLVGRRHAGQRGGGQCLRGRHHAARGARQALRHAGRDVRHRLHPRAGDGRLLGGIDLHLPFFVAGTLALLNLAYGWFVLPESLPPERAPFDWRAPTR
jgi:DHA1 family tetracycline resistance protein-like MFS transporter